VAPGRQSADTKIVSFSDNAPRSLGLMQLVEGFQISLELRNF